jgi:hypothetical protein
MKIILFCLLLTFAVTGVGLAQTEKGTQYLGLGLSARTKTEKSTGSTNETVRQSSFGITPNYSYFIADRWELRGGIGIGLSKSRSKGDEYLSKSTSYGLAPQIAVRRHLMVSDKLGFATGPYVFYAFDKDDYQNSDKTTTEQFQTGIDLQIEYFPTKNLGVSAGLLGISYSTIKFTEADQERFKSSSFSAGLTNQLNLRVFYVIRKGSKN